MLVYRRDIDGLRAIAIASVVLFHTGFATFGGGYVGVDIFFVISGFLITSIIVKEESEGGFSFLRFYERRARRILPALFFMLTLVTIASAVILLPKELSTYGKHLIYSVLFVANFKFMVTPDYFNPVMQETPLLHMWSLAVEEQFYFVWPALLLFIMRRSSARRTRALVLALGAISLLLAAYFVSAAPKTAFYHLPSRGWELLVGAALALGFMPPVRTRMLAEALSLAGLALMIAPVFLYTKDTPFPGFAAIPPVLGCALAIHAQTYVKTRAAALLSLQPLVFLGLISYSLYLWHWPLLALPAAMRFHALPPLEAIPLLMAAVGVSIFSWRFIEQPFRKHSATARPAITLPGLPAAPRVAYAAFAWALVLGLSGSYLQESHGARWRFSPEMRVLVPEKTGVLSQETCTHLTMRTKHLEECHVGTASAQNPGDFFLWGDSHGEHYLPAVAKIFGNGTAMLQGGCMPLIGVRWVDAKGAPIGPTCDVAKLLVLKDIERLKPKLVILAARWTFAEDMPYGVDGSPSGFLQASDSDPLTREQSHKVFRAALQRTVNALTEGGAKVMLLGQVPETGFLVGRCVAMTRHLGLDETPCRSIDRAAVEERQAFINGALREAAEENPNVAVFWPIPTMCDSQSCYTGHADKVFYLDGNHITKEGSLSLAAAIEAAVPANFLTGAPLERRSAGAETNSVAQ